MTEEQNYEKSIERTKKIITIIVIPSLITVVILMGLGIIPKGF